MDALNEVLKTLHMKSTVYCRAEFTAPWGYETPGDPSRAGFFFVTRGNCWLQMGKEDKKEEIELAGGDFILFPHGSPYILADKAGSLTCKFEELKKSIDCSERKLRFGGGGSLTTLVVGCFQFEGHQTNPLLAVLPDVIHVKGEEGRAVPWLETTFQYLASETASTLPGADTVITHLTDILFIQAVRAYIGSPKNFEQGLIKAVKDPQIGRAVALMHNAPEESWTVRSLAVSVGMSRAAFSARFRQLVGEPPVQYLTRWRMHKAAEMLRSGEESLSQIAIRVGYIADPAFSKAFKRWMGSPPGTYRQRSRLPDGSMIQNELSS